MLQCWWLWHHDNWWFTSGAFISLQCWAIKATGRCITDSRGNAHRRARSFSWNRGIVYRATPFILSCALFRYGTSLRSTNMFVVKDFPRNVVLVPHKMTTSCDFWHNKIKTVFGEMVCRCGRSSATHVREPVANHCCTWGIACYTCGKRVHNWCYHLIVFDFLVQIWKRVCLPRWHLTFHLCPMSESKWVSWWCHSVPHPTSSVFTTQAPSRFQSTRVDSSLRVSCALPWTGGWSSSWRAFTPCVGDSRSIAWTQPQQHWLCNIRRLCICACYDTELDRANPESNRTTRDSWDRWVESELNEQMSMVRTCTSEWSARETLRAGGEISVIKYTNERSKSV